MDECPHDPDVIFYCEWTGKRNLSGSGTNFTKYDFCFGPNECLYHAEYDQIGHRVSTLRIKVRKFGSSPFRVSLPGQENEIPILILWRALGGQDDEWQLYIDAGDAQSSVEDASVALTKESAMEWLNQHFDDAQVMLDRQVYPNMDTKLKSLQLCRQWSVYLTALHKHQRGEENAFSDRDHSI